MQYLALRWFTLSYFEKDKLKLFHTLERAIQSAKTDDVHLSWHEQTENYLRREFTTLLTKNTNCRLHIFQKFKKNLQNLMKQNNLTSKHFLSDINFMQKCDEIIYHKAHETNAS